MVGKLVEESRRGLRLELPLAGGIGWNLHASDVGGERLPGGRVWVQWSEIERSHDG